MTRFWVTLDNVVVREWTKDEYDRHNPEICIKDDVLAIVATQEWKDYLRGRSNIIPVTKEE